MKEIKITIIVEDEAGVAGRKESLSFESAADNLGKLERCYKKNKEMQDFLHELFDKHGVKEEIKEELTGCCDASIVEQTGRCSKCLESV